MIEIIVAWLPTSISAILLATIFVGKNWLKARIEGNISHDFNQKLAAITTELRKHEAQFASELHSKEAEISALRDNVLGGRANRQALLDKRRFDAVEKVWTTVNDLAPLKGLSAAMAVLKFKAVAKRVNDPKCNSFFLPSEEVWRPMERK